MLVDLCQVFGLNLQKYALMKAAETDHASARCNSTNACCNWRWLLAFALYVLGQLIDAASHAFGSQELLVTLTVLAIGGNALVAQYLFDETFNWRPLYWPKVITQWTMWCLSCNNIAPISAWRVSSPGMISYGSLFVYSGGGMQPLFLFVL